LDAGFDGVRGAGGIEFLAEDIAGAGEVLVVELPGELVGGAELHADILGVEAFDGGLFLADLGFSNADG
jgi:hypothetical protein